MQDPQPTPRKRLVQTFEWVVGIAAEALTVAGFVLTNLPKLSVDVSGSLRPNDLTGTIFSLSNEGLLPVYDVKAGCEVVRLDIPPPGQRYVVEPTTLHFLQSRVEILSPGHKMTVSCGPAIASKVDNMEMVEIHAEMFIVVTYRPKWLVAQIGKVPDQNGENRRWDLDMEEHSAMRYRA